jgi:hypothetical protein
LLLRLTIFSGPPVLPVTLLMKPLSELDDSAF